MPRSRTPKGRRQAESRHSCRVLYSQSASIFRPTRNDTWVVPPYSNVTSLPFLSGSEERRQPPKSRSSGFCSEQPEIVARQMATLESVQQKERDNNPFALKVLKVLRGLLLKKSPKWGLGQRPKVLKVLINRSCTFLQVTYH